MKKQKKHVKLFEEYAGGFDRDYYNSAENELDSLEGAPKMDGSRDVYVVTESDPDYAIFYFFSSEEKSEAKFQDLVQRAENGEFSTRLIPEESIDKDHIKLKGGQIIKAEVTADYVAATSADDVETIRTEASESAENNIFCGVKFHGGEAKLYIGSAEEITGDAELVYLKSYGEEWAMKDGELEPLD